MDFSRDFDLDGRPSELKIQTPEPKEPTKSEQQVEPEKENGSKASDNKENKADESKEEMISCWRHCKAIWQMD